jgi:hypothetical protein
MIRLNHDLIRSARHFTTGANVHRVNEMIFVYEQAVLLHNKALHPTYQAEHERKLRKFVEGECLRAARMKIVA